MDGFLFRHVTRSWSLYVVISIPSLQICGLFHCLHELYKEVFSSACESAWLILPLFYMLMIRWMNVHGDGLRCFKTNEIKRLRLGIPWCSRFCVSLGPCKAVFLMDSSLLQMYYTTWNSEIFNQTQNNHWFCAYCGSIEETSKGTTYVDSHTSTKWSKMVMISVK